MSRRTTHASAHPPIRPPAVDTIQPLRHLHRHRRRGYESRQRTLLLGREHQVEGGARRPGGHRVYGVQVGDHDDTQLLGGEDRQLGGIAAERASVVWRSPIGSRTVTWMVLAKVAARIRWTTSPSTPNPASEYLVREPGGYTSSVWLRLFTTSSSEACDESRSLPTGGSRTSPERCERSSRRVTDFPNRFVG